MVTFRSIKGPKMGDFLPLFDRNVCGICLLEGHIDAGILRARQRGKRRYVVEALLNFRRERNLRRLGQLQLGFGSLRRGWAWRWSGRGRWRADGDGFYFDARRGCFGYCGRGSWCFGFRFRFGWGGSNRGGAAKAVDRLGHRIRLPGRQLGRGGGTGVGSRSGLRLRGSAGRQRKASKNDKKTARCHGNPP